MPARRRSTAVLLHHEHRGVCRGMPMVVLAVGLATAGHGLAEMTVSAQVTAEEDSQGVPGVVRFSLVLSAPEAAPTVWEFATSSDTAREGSDFIGRRGSVSIAAGETTAVVEVPLVADEIHEPNESLALIVWPAGGTPAPTLTAVVPPPDGTPAGSWTPTPGSISVSEGRFYRQGSVCRREGTSWLADRPVTLPQNAAGPPLLSALDGASLVLSDLDPQPPIQRQQFWHYDATSTASPLPSDFSGGVRHSWQSDGVSIPPGAVAMAGGRLAVLTDRSIDFFRIGVDRPAALQFTNLIDTMAPFLAFDGRRCFYESAINPNTKDVQRGLVVLESSNGDWSQAKGPRSFVPNLTVPMALEGDTLLAARRDSTTGPWGFYAIVKRDAWEDGNWHDQGSLPKPPDGLLGRNWMVAMRGAVALVADAGLPGVATSREGRILVYVRDPAGSQWQLSGTFKSPDTNLGDGFGIALGHAGLNVVVQSAASQNSLPRLYAGSFPGAVATITDNDTVLGTLSSAAIIEPSTGTAEMRLRFDLEDPSDEEVTLFWRTRDGSALAGSDYVAKEGVVTLAPGELTAWLPIVVTADTESEEEESFTVEITQLAGALLSGNPDAHAECRILPAAQPQAIVTAAGASVYEDIPGAGNSRINSSPRANGESLTVEWRTAEVARLETALSPVPLQDTARVAAAGKDFVVTSGRFTTASPDVRTVPLTVSSDGILEPFAERASLALSLPRMATAGSFGVRAAAWPPLSLGGLSSSGFSQVSTNGDWIVAAEPVNRGSSPRTTFVRGFHFFERDPGAPGGWKNSRNNGSWTDPFPPGRMKMRQDRLVYHGYEPGLIWVFRKNLGGVGRWGLEAVLKTDPLPSNPVGTGGWRAPELDFDGHTLVHLTVPWPYDHAKIIIHSFEAGQWQPREELLDFEAVPSQAGPWELWNRHPKIAGDTIVISSGSNLTGPMIRRIRRNGPPGARWSLEPPIRLEGPPLDRFLSDALLFDGDRLVLGMTNTDPGLTHVYRRQSDDTWSLEAALPDRPEDLQPGLLRGKTWLWRDTGDPSTPWQAIAPHETEALWPPYSVTSEPPDRHRNVSVSIGSLPYAGVQDGVPGLLIAEPGADWQILDEDYVFYSAAVVSSAYETLDKAEAAVIEVTASIPLPADVTIPYATAPGGTATPGIDYVPVSGELRIASGQRVARLAVPILPDATVDPGETVIVDLGKPSFGKPTNPRTTLTIADRPPEVLPPDPPLTVTEPATGSQLFDVVCRMPLAFDHPVTVAYAIVSGTAGSADVELASGSVTVPSGGTAFRVPLVVRADSIQEASEYVTVRITPPGATQPTLIQVTIANVEVGDGVADGYSTTQDQLMDISSELGALANDPPSIIATQLHSAPLHGQVEWRPDGGFAYRPAPNFIGVDRLAYVPSNGGGRLLDFSATWKWLHPTDGRDPEASQPGFQLNWTKPDFDDTSWSDGTGLMAYGVIGSGEGMPITTPIGTPALGNRYTAYFRTRFVAPSNQPKGVTVHIAVDDAAIISLNGEEIGRAAPSVDPAFMAAPDTYTLGCASFRDFDQETTALPLRFPEAQVRPGLNVLAISVHNQQPGSSDLALRVDEVSTTQAIAPVEVLLTVLDGGRPPVVSDDSYEPPAMTAPLDSRRLPDGSAYRNDGLVDNFGVAFDPVLEAEIGGNPAGPVTFDAATGHFRMAAPPDFFGPTSFTYRVRDKDGWSNVAVVSILVPPVRAFDVWRHRHFGGASNLAASGALADDEGDGLANLTEFALGTDPKSIDPSATLQLRRESGAWTVDFLARDRFGDDAFISLDWTDTLTNGAWRRLAWLNDVYQSAQSLAPGVDHRLTPTAEGRILHSLTLPPDASPAGFLRLRVSREKHPEDP